MEWLTLKPKEAVFFADEVKVADELITGLLTKTFWMVEVSGSTAPVESFALMFFWPRKKDGSVPNIVSFLTGHSPELAKTIEFYEA